MQYTLISIKNYHNRCNISCLVRVLNDHDYKYMFLVSPFKSSSPICTFYPKPNMNHVNEVTKFHQQTYPKLCSDHSNVSNCLFVTLVLGTKFWGASEKLLRLLFMFFSFLFLIFQLGRNYLHPLYSSPQFRLLEFLFYPDINK